MWGVCQKQFMSFELTSLCACVQTYQMKDGKAIYSSVQEVYRSGVHALAHHCNTCSPHSRVCCSPKGTFEDPLMDCKGYQEISLALYSLPKLFSKVEVRHALSHALIFV